MTSCKFVKDMNRLETANGQRGNPRWVSSWIPWGGITRTVSIVLTSGGGRGWCLFWNCYRTSYNLCTFYINPECCSEDRKHKPPKTECLPKKKKFTQSSPKTLRTQKEQFDSPVWEKTTQETRRNAMRGGPLLFEWSSLSRSGLHRNSRRGILCIRDSHERKTRDDQVKDEFRASIKDAEFRVRIS